MFKKAYAFFLILVLPSFPNFVSAQELKEIKLPKPQTEIGKPLMQVLKLRSSSRNFSEKEIPIQELSNILWAANGINRIESGKRTAPSARNWQEIDVYVSLAEGVYLYDAKLHSLHSVIAGDLRAMCGVQDFVKTAPVNLVYVSDYSKIKSNDNDEVKLMWTSAGVGFIAQNVYLYCASQGFACVIRGLIERTKLAEALKLKEDQKIILSQTVGYPK
jgi:SagB-type dehydrogenase family enzyme